jgi:hypothetical protein
MKLKRLMALSLSICTAATPVISFAADSPAGNSGATAAPAKADLSTPKGAALTFANALVSGDNAAIRACSVGSDTEYKTLESLSTMVSAMKKLSDAAVEKFGKDNVITKGSNTDIAAEIEKSTAKEEGDTATIVNKDKPDDKNPMKLKKVGSDWKVDLAQTLPKDGVDMLSKMAPAMAKVANEVTAEIKAGKFMKADEAKEALGTRMLAAMMQPPPQQ